MGQVLSTGARQVEARGSLVCCSGVWELAALAEGLADMLTGRGRATGAGSSAVTEEPLCFVAEHGVS